MYWSESKRRWRIGPRMTGSKGRSSKNITEGKEKADEPAKEGAMLHGGFMAQARASAVQQEREVATDGSLLGCRWQVGSMWLGSGAVGSRCSIGAFARDVRLD